MNKFLSALSTLPSTSSPTNAKKHSKSTRAAPSTSTISAASSTRQFDTFIRSISRLKTLGEARRLRADVEREQRGATAALDDEVRRAGEGKEAETRLRTARRYAKRLERAKLEIDARIAVLLQQQGRVSVSPGED